MEPLSNDRSAQGGLDRRSFFSRSAASLAASGAAASLLAQGHVALAQATTATAPAGYALPKLTYAYDALEPSIDAETMMIHHDKHHQAYIDKALAALAGHADLLAKAPADLIRNLSSVPAEIKTAVQNQVGGHVNHSFFWKILGPGKGGEPSGKLADAIKQTFGGFDQFKTKFTDAATKQFGSGWAWLVKGDGGALEVVGTPNQDSPLTAGKTPIVGLDVWEHAYYLKYRNVRADYIANWWKVVNWDQAAENFAA